MSAMVVARPVDPAVVPAKVPPLLPPEEWEYLDAGVLQASSSGAVCITCQHFRYEVGNHCVTVLTCPMHQGLIPQGEHLTRRCAQWSPRREVTVGWCPEAGWAASLFVV